MFEKSNTTWDRPQGISNRTRKVFQKLLTPQFQTSLESVVLMKLVQNITLLALNIYIESVEQHLTTIYKNIIKDF